MKKWLSGMASLLFCMVILPYLILLFWFGPGKCVEIRKLDSLNTVLFWNCAVTLEEGEREAEKAEVVIIRTNLYETLSHGKSIYEMAGELKEEIQKKKVGEEKKKKCLQLLEETKGQVLEWKGQFRKLPVHLCSGERTRDGKELLGEDYGYLTSVESPWDCQAKEYKTEIVVDTKHFPKKLEVTMRDSAGYVLAVSLNGELRSGEEVRRMFGLPSGNFSVSENQEKLVFLCKGQGHGFGYSRFGGQKLARNGKRYKEILRYYFPEMELSR